MKFHGRGTLGSGDPNGPGLPAWSARNEGDGLRQRLERHALAELGETLGRTLCYLEGAEFRSGGGGPGSQFRGLGAWRCWRGPLLEISPQV